MGIPSEKIVCPHQIFTSSRQSFNSSVHKVLTYIEYRTVYYMASSELLTPPPPLHPASVSPPPAPKAGGGVYTRQEVRGWGVNISEDARHWIGLLQYNPPTGH
jgi:hypothetical protein